LLILLGLQQPPPVRGTEDTRPNEIKRQYSHKDEASNLGGRYEPDEVRRFCAAVEEKLKAGVLPRDKIIQSLKADEERLEVKILPRAIKGGRKGRIPSNEYMYAIIYQVRKKVKIYKPSRTEQIVFLALSGLDRKQTRAQLECSSSIVADVFNALGISSRTRRKGYIIDTSIRDACKAAKEKFYKMQKEKQNVVL
jgi:hypothetical protein